MFGDCHRSRLGDEVRREGKTKGAAAPKRPRPPDWLTPTESRTATEPTTGTAAAMSDGSTLGGRGSGTAPDLGRMQGDGLAAIGAVDNPLGRSGEQCRNLDTQRRRDFF